MIKTQTICHDDGSVEVVRLISTKNEDSWSKNDPLAYEKSIVWTEDVRPYKYVRVTHVCTARSRRGPLLCNGSARVIGYAKLTPDAPVSPSTQTYTRRLFYVLNTDGIESVPAGAVDPRTVLPGIAGDTPA